MYIVNNTIEVNEINEAYRIHQRASFKFTFRFFEKDLIANPIIIPLKRIIQTELKLSKRLNLTIIEE